MFFSYEIILWTIPLKTFISVVRGFPCNLVALNVDH